MKRDEEQNIRKVYNMESKTVNFGNVKAIDSMNNRRIHVTKGRSRD